jgi:hypothetical protein
VRFSICIIAFGIACLVIFASLHPAVAQNLPDAPSQALATSAQKISIWHQNWYDYYATHHRTAHQVFTNKSYWAFVGTDVLASSFDAEMSHHQGRCVEGGEGLPIHPTRWQLYEHNLPENVAVIVAGFIETKAKMPRWLMFTGDIYPAQAHLRAGLRWYQDCW